MHRCSQFVIIFPYYSWLKNPNRLCAGQPGNEDFCRTGGKDFPLFPQPSDLVWDPRNIVYDGNWGPFPVEERPGREAIRDINLESRMQLLSILPAHTSPCCHAIRYGDLDTIRALHKMGSRLLS